MQFGAKPLFENISVKFGNGNRYGLIGTNGCGKSTFMKILGGDLEPTSGNVSVDINERVGKLRQDQFAFENHTVLDTVIMGHERLWQVKQERDRIYALPHMSEAEGMQVAELEVEQIMVAAEKWRVCVVDDPVAGTIVVEELVDHVGGGAEAVIGISDLDLQTEEEEVPLPRDYYSPDDEVPT